MAAGVICFEMFYGRVSPVCAGTSRDRWLASYFRFSGAESGMV